MRGYEGRCRTLDPHIPLLSFHFVARSSSTRISSASEMADFLSGFLAPEADVARYPYVVCPRGPYNTAATARTRLTLISLPVELQCAILSVAHPLSIMAARKTCRSLYRASMERTVWTFVLRRLCLQHNVSFSTYPADMSLKEIEGAATAASRLVRLAQRLSKGPDDLDTYLEPRISRTVALAPLSSRPDDELYRAQLCAGGRYYVGVTQDTIHLYDLRNLRNGDSQLFSSIASMRFIDRSEDGIPILKTWPTPDNTGIEILIECEAVPVSQPCALIVLEIYPQSRTPSFRQVGRFEERVTRFHSRIGDLIWFSDDIEDICSLGAWNYRTGRHKRWRTLRQLDTVVSSRDTIISFSDILSYVDKLETYYNPADDEGPWPDSQYTLVETQEDVAKGVDYDWAYGYYGSSSQGPAYFSVATIEEELLTHRVVNYSNARSEPWPSKLLCRSPIPYFWKRAPAKVSEQDELLVFTWQYEGREYGSGTWMYLLSDEIDSRGVASAWNVGIVYIEGEGGHRGDFDPVSGRVCLYDWRSGLLHVEDLLNPPPGGSAF